MDKRAAPCITCSGFSKWVDRGMYIHHPDTNQIKEWIDDDAFNDYSNGSTLPAQAELKEDVVNHPKHYKGHPSGVECIQITEHMGFNLGNAVKYIWRCDLKKDAIEDLKKAIWYLEREVKLRESNL
jgi:hypothetical protein